MERHLDIYIIILVREMAVPSIFKHLVDEVTILETMTPLDFLEFRNYLSPASGFQSVQFRLIENKLGVKNELMTNCGSIYQKMFEDKLSEEEPSLCDLIELWLEKIPGLQKNEFDFWPKYERAVKHMFEQNRREIQMESHQQKRAILQSECKRKIELFDSLLNINEHNCLVVRGTRRFSHLALQGALMISLYRDEPRFNQSFQILMLLIDIDSLLTKWRLNHMELVYRMNGACQSGTGGSAGYNYLRSTLSDRNRIFVDLLNLPRFFIPRKYIPPLTLEI